MKSDDMGHCTPNRDSRVITINPSNAFGTGHHTTTQLCLEILCRLDLRGARTLNPQLNKLEECESQRCFGAL